MENIAEAKLSIISIKAINGKKCVAKKLEPKDLSYFLEMEASRRMLSHDQIYNVMKIFKENDENFIASEYVNGMDLYEKLDTLTDQQIISLLCQVMMMINFIHNANISHNDLHLRNIRVQDTLETFLEYDVGGRIYRLPTFGVKAVIIDFGLATIIYPSGKFKVASEIYCGDSFLRLDVRYDMFRFLGAFVGSIALKFKTGRFPCMKMIKFIYDAITGPQKVNTKLYFTLSWMIPKEFKQYLWRTYRFEAEFTSKFLNYLIILPRFKKEFTKLDKLTAVKKLTSHTFPKTDNHLFTFITTKVMNPDSEWVFVIVQIWDEFIQMSSHKFKEKIDAVFHKTYFQNPLDIVDIIVAAFLV